MLLLVGCATAGAPASQSSLAHVQGPAIASPSTSIGPVASVEAAAAMAEPVPPNEATSATRPSKWALLQEWWTTDTARVLRTPSGREFATLTQAIYLRLAPQGGPIAEAWTHGVLLNTTPRAGDLPVFARNGFAFAGVLHTGRATALEWTPTGDGRMRVAPPQDPRLRFMDRPHIEVAFAELSLMSGGSEPAVLDHTLAGRGPIALAAEAGGAAVVELRLRRAVDVTLLERSGRAAKIAWPIDDKALAGATVVGWVDGRLLTAKAAGTPVGSVERAELEGEVSMDWGGCLQEHALLVDVGGGSEVVGKILPGTRVRAGDRRGELVAVEIVGPSARYVPAPLQLRRGAQFLLSPDAATDCAR